jgi:hypothetical protein
MFKIQELLQQVNKDGRRLDRRMAYSQVVRYRLNKGPFQRAKLEDVSGGGLRLNIPRYVPKGSKVQVLYNQPLCSRQYWVEGRVTWSREVESQYATGVEIDFKSDFDELPFRNMLEQLATTA